MSVSQDIRRALEQRLVTVAGLPTDRGWETVDFEPTPGTPYVKMMIEKDTTRPEAMGDAAQKLHEGEAIVTVAYPLGSGAVDAELVSDAIRDAFPTSLVLSEGSHVVRFRWAEPRLAINDRPWYVVTSAIRWYVYSDST